MQDWSLYLDGNFDLLFNYSIPKAGLGVCGGGGHL